MCSSSNIEFLRITGTVVVAVSLLDACKHTDDDNGNDDHKQQLLVY